RHRRAIEQTCTVPASPTARQTNLRTTESARNLARPGSGGEDDEHTRIGVEEVPASDRRELTVAEKAGERERSQVLLDQRDVVVRNPVQPLATPGAIEVATERRAPPVELVRHTRKRQLEVFTRRIGVAELELDG